jgi:hypothetical protein
MLSVTSEFLQKFSVQLWEFLKLVPFMNTDGQDRTNYTRRFYLYTATQAELAEMLLDGYGARENCTWFFLRELVAAVRSFGKVGYILCYLEHQESEINDADEDLLAFQKICGDIRQEVDIILQKAFARIEQEAHKLKLTIPPYGLKCEDFPQFEVLGRIPRDLWVGQTDQEEEEAVVKIATTYLKIVDDYVALGFGRIFTPQELQEIVPARVNEERVRIFEAEVHNVQSVYDTYIQNTRLEANDERLIKLRESVTTALHLLEIATVLVHFHERHERHARHPDIYQQLQTITGPHHVLELMGNYALFYCTRFLAKGKALSEETVMDYAQIQSKQIPIPAYRGFHVRPATYIAKIIRRYSADVQMHLEDEVYDAGNVFELFRANEKINMEKRQLIAKKLFTAQHITATTPDLLLYTMRMEVEHLVAERAIVCHQEICPEDLVVSELRTKDLFSAEEVRGCTNELLTRLLALGKIDIIMPLLVTFIGDKRALRDIEILALGGYGEDVEGNNIPLPPELSYLYKS